MDPWEIEEIISFICFLAILFYHYFLLLFPNDVEGYLLDVQARRCVQCNEICQTWM